MNTLNKFARIRPVVAADFPVLEALAKEDDHQLIAPSHVVEKDGNIIGFLSIAQIPNVLMWLHTERATPRDAAAVANFFECWLLDRGARTFVVPCLETSPFFPYISQLDYVNIGKTNLFLKVPKE